MIESIKNDNVEQFENDFSDYLKYGSVFFGAYSLLSVLYIFNAKKILHKFKNNLVENYFSDEIILDEELEIDEKFSNLAKTNYREYKKATAISPIEVLFLQGKYKKAMHLSEKINLNAEQQKRINTFLENSLDKKFIVSSTLKWSETQKIKQKYSFTNWKFITSIFSICFVLVSFLFVLTNQTLRYGDGSLAHPYRIYQLSDLEKINDYEYYILMNDIDLTSAETIQTFSGHLDCQNHTIKTNKTIFDNMSGSIKNGYIKVESDVIITSEYYGFLCNINSGLISNIKQLIYNINITFNNSIDMYCGLVVGKNEGTINTVDIYNGIDIKTNSLNCESLQYGNNQTIGLIVGRNEGNIDNSENWKNMTSSFQDIGGICGYNDTNGYISSSINYGNLSITNSSQTWTAIIGGIAQFNKGTIKKSKNVGLISATSLNNDVYAGGVCGYQDANGNIDGCSNNSQIIGNAQQSICCGGICGYSKSETIIKYSKNNADIQAHSTNGSAFAGGIVGRTAGNIEYCLANQNIISATDDEDVNNYISLTGGIVAKSNGNITNCISMSNCKDAYYNGGIVGKYVDGSSVYQNNYWLTSETSAIYAEAYNQNNDIAKKYSYKYQIQNLYLYDEIIKYAG